MKRLLLVAAVVCITGACDYGTDADVFRPPGVPLADTVVDGKELYLRDCAWCHGNDGTGTARGPDILAAPNGQALVDLVLRSGRMPLTSADERMIRRDPIYSEAQIDALVGFVASLGTEGPDIPELALEGVDLAHGGELYQENCAACHSTTGIGGALTEGRVVSETGVPARSRIVVPPVTDASPIEIAEAIRTGPGTMPVFGDEVFDEPELDALVAYAHYLKHPDDRGGAGLGRIGPVAEGAVGWLVGLGVLLIFIRWVGTKRGEP